MQSLISVITPIYKAERFLDKCISSVLTQSYTNFELLLIDDGSPDNSGAICDKYAKNDSRIKVFHKKNGGVSSARNYGLDLAQGEFILFLDSDDYLSQDALMICYKTMREKSLDILQFSIQGITEEGILTNKTTIKRRTTDILSSDEYIKEEQLQVCAGGSCIRRNIIEKNKIRFEKNIKLAEDQLFIISSILSSRNIKFENVVLYYYLDNPSSATHTNNSADVINSIDALQNFITKHPSSKMILKKQILNFICVLLRNRDVSLRKVSEIVHNKSFEYSRNLRSSEKLFALLSKVSFKLACCVTQLLFSIYDSIKIHR